MIFLVSKMFRMLMIFGVSRRLRAPQGSASRGLPALQPRARKRARCRSARPSKGPALRNAQSEQFILFFADWNASMVPNQADSCRLEFMDPVHPGGAGKSLGAARRSLKEPSSSGGYKIPSHPLFFAVTLWSSRVHKPDSLAYVGRGLWPIRGRPSIAYIRIVEQILKLF